MYMDRDTENDDVVVEADGSQAKVSRNTRSSPDVSSEETFRELELEDIETQIDSKVTKLKTELEKVKTEKQEYLDGWQRAKADYVNALKRFEEEKRGAMAMGRIVTVGAFIPVMDSLARAEGAGELPEAFAGIARQLHEAAKSLGLEQFGTVGEAFDPNQHEALGQDATEEIEKDDTVSAVLEPGWKSKEVVVRPAKVRVAHFE